MPHSWTWGSAVANLRNAKCSQPLAAQQRTARLLPISNKLFLLQHVLGFVQVTADGQELALLAMRPEQGLVTRPEAALVRLAAPAVAGIRASPWELHLVKLQVRYSAAALQICMWMSTGGALGAASLQKIKPAS